MNNQLGLYPLVARNYNEMRAYQPGITETILNIDMVVYQRGNVYLSP